MYNVKIEVASIHEIQNISDQMGLDFWEGVKVKTKEYADFLVNVAKLIEPKIELSVVEVAL